MSEIHVAVVGGGWVTGAGYGRLGSGKAPQLSAGRPVIPAAAEIFARTLARYGRFDDYTKMGCAGVALALTDAGLAESRARRPIGIVVSTRWESTKTDLAYYETALPAGGALSSPNLFSYTLPGIVLGECAAHFGLSGPTLCVGEDGSLGYSALCTALRLLAADACPAVIAGWLDDPPAPADARTSGASIVPGAIFVILECRPRDGHPALHWVQYSRGTMSTKAGTRIASLLDLFGNEALASNPR